MEIVVGQEFKKWTVTGPVKRLLVGITSKRYTYKVPLKHICGYEVDYKRSELLLGKTPLCIYCGFNGTGTPLKLVYPGAVFGRLTVLEADSSRHPKSKTLMSTCRCSCGSLHNVISYSLVSGDALSCGCAAKEQVGKQHYAYKGHGDITGAQWSSILIHARHRNLPVDISIEDAWGVLENQEHRCAYTGWPVTCLKPDRSASLDRIDNMRGYTLDNVQWVHKHVNIMKRDHTEDYFLMVCRAIASHRL